MIEKLIVSFLANIVTHTEFIHYGMLAVMTTVAKISLSLSLSLSLSPPSLSPILRMLH